METLLFQRELVAADVADPEALGAAGQVLHVPLVDLFGLDLEGLVLARLEGLGPQVKGPGEIRLQRLDPGHVEARLRRELLDGLGHRQPATREDVGHDEPDELSHLHRYGYATLDHLPWVQARD